MEKNYSPEIKKLLQDIKAILTKVNQEQAQKREGIKKAKYIVHGTHVAKQTFKDIYAKNHPEVKLGNAEMMLPAFQKETQNELDAIKDLQQKFVESYIEKHPELAGKETYEVLMEAGYPMGADLQKELGIPERVFGIPSKSDDNNQPIFDEKGVPVPQDGSYAYALKKCSYSINFSEDNHPILIGSETRFADFESGNKKGHIFILEGENFKPEIDKQGNITEYTAAGDVKVVHHQEVTPKDVMQHNGQLIMFRSEEDYDRWSAKGHFDFIIKNGSEKMESLAEEIRAGRATYINATHRGEKPLIASLEQAQIQRTVSEHLTNFHNKLKTERTDPVPENKSKTPEQHNMLSKLAKEYNSGKQH